MCYKYICRYNVQVSVLLREANKCSSVNCCFCCRIFEKINFVVGTQNDRLYYFKVLVIKFSGSNMRCIGQKKKMDALSIYKLPASTIILYSDCSL